MYEQEKIKPYATDERKGVQVAKMFDNIAHSYDKLNHLLSFGIDRRWRREALLSLKAHAPQNLLDVATGTGDFALLAAELLRPKQILGVDISEGMLEVGRAKVAKAGEQERITLQVEDCMQLSLPDASFDAATVAYGVRNFEDLEQGLRELCRVLKPNGRLVIIELTTPQRFPMKQLFKFYASVVMPCVGRLISKDKAAYTYLPATMEAFPQGEVMQEVLLKAGFREATFKRFTFGISTLYVAVK